MSDPNLNNIQLGVMSPKSKVFETRKKSVHHIAQPTSNLHHVQMNNTNLSEISRSRGMFSFLPKFDYCTNCTFNINVTNQQPK